MALVFYGDPQAPPRAAVEISRALRDQPRLPVRMGVHSGSVTGVIDVNGHANLAGAGLNIAQRVMDCGDAGHILVSKHAADDLHEYPQWTSQLHPLGTVEVKHGVKLQLVNLWTEEIGNRQIPAKIRAQRRGITKKRVVWASVIAAVLAIAFYAFLFHRGGSAAAAATNSIAVLPFKPLLPENRDPVLEIGLADTLITKLGNTHEIVVPSLTSVRKFADRDSVEAGRQLGVASVLEGSLVKAANRLRVNARLLKVADGSSMWAQTFDEELTDVFKVEDIISQKVVEALTVRLTAEGQRRLVKPETENLEAYQLYLTGRYHWNKLIPPEIAQSIGFFERAVELDPKYALAYFGLAESYRVLAITSDMPAKEVLPKAKAAAQRALELDDSMAGPHATLALVHMWFDWDWTAAREEGERGVKISPNSAYCHMAYAHVFSNLGEHDRAIAEAARARELDPTSLITGAREGAVLFYAGKLDQARDRLLKTIELDSTFWVAHLFLGMVELSAQHFATAINEFEKAKEFSHDNSQAIAMIGVAAARAGDAPRAREILNELNALSAKRYIPPYNIGVLDAALGDTPQALASLEKAYADRDVHLCFIKIDPFWDPVRNDPGFAPILKRINLH